jgi:hypothetical protein
MLASFAIIALRIAIHSNDNISSIRKVLIRGDERAIAVFTVEWVARQVITLAIMACH